MNMQRPKQFVETDSAQNINILIKNKERAHERMQLNIIESFRKITN